MSESLTCCRSAFCTNRSDMVFERRTKSGDRPRVECPCGSRSTSKTLLCKARKAERLMDVVVFPHPPFWFTIAIVRISFLQSAFSCGAQLKARLMERQVADTRNGLGPLLIRHSQDGMGLIRSIRNSGRRKNLS